MKKISTRAVAILLSVVIVFGALITGLEISFTRWKKQGVWSPDYKMVDIDEVLMKIELSADDYALLYQQTGLTKLGVDGLMQNRCKDKIKLIQTLGGSKRDILTKVDDFQHSHILLVKPPIDVSTPWVYKNLKLNEITSHPDTDMVINCLKNAKLNELKECSMNLLETVTEKEYQQIKDIKDKMYSYDAIFSMMSGSGPSVFGIFGNEEDLDKAYRYFVNMYSDTYKVKTVNNV